MRDGKVLCAGADPATCGSCEHATPHEPHNAGWGMLCCWVTWKCQVAGRKVYCEPFEGKPTPDAEGMERPGGVGGEDGTGDV
jgi:hypothetical protein